MAVHSSKIQPAVRTVRSRIIKSVSPRAHILIAPALYNPVWTSSFKTPGDFGIALLGFVLLTAWRAPPLLVVVVSALGGIALALAKL